jgi:hypothetical protein
MGYFGSSKICGISKGMNEQFLSAAQKPTTKPNKIALYKFITQKLIFLFDMGFVFILRSCFKIRERTRLFSLFNI